MAAAAPIPVPVEGAAVAEAPMGEMFKNYDPTGALGGMFVPGYIKGYEPSEKAVAEWQAQNHGMTRAMIDELRMPAEWRDPNEGTFWGAGHGFGPYGAGGIPNNLTFGDQRGTVDPEALRVLAQGGKYDIEGRRSAIAARLLANQIAQAPKPQQATDNPWAPQVHDHSGFMRYEYQND